MNVLEELIYYCNESQPAGALMLTGEWGCGKTYLIENELNNSIKDSHILIRISLFGLESINDVKTEVKRCWFNEFVNQTSPIKFEKNKTESISKGIKSAINSVSDFLPEPFKSIITGALTINTFDFVEVKPEIDNKRIVLIFDDLERSNISTSDLLGCINDYCENLHISTIIVANEDKISNGRNDKIKYNEIKEKIVQRTINYNPDYSFVISNIIDEYVIDDETSKYKEFLINNKENLSILFSHNIIDETKFSNISNGFYGLSNEEQKEISVYKSNILPIIKNKPHNIRSFKYAIQDFKRIFLLLEEKGIVNKEKYIFSFISYVLCYRNRDIYNCVNNKYVTFESIVNIMYPMFFNSRYISNGITEWIKTGEWDDETINSELDYFIQRDTAITPEEKVRSNRLLDLEEDDIEKGFPKVIEEAYNGELDLNEYVYLICNCSIARGINLDLPTIDWDKVCKGIDIKINDMIKSKEKKCSSNAIIEHKDKEKFINGEWKAYQLIEDFRFNDVLTCSVNRNYYLDELKKDPIETLLKSKGLKLNTFDIEMAKTTFDVFRNLKNFDKTNFISCFDDLWNFNIGRNEFDVKKDDDGFLELKNMLVNLSKENEDKKHFVSKNCSDNFITLVERLIEKQQLKTNH